MDMNRAFFLRKEDANPQWRVIDARGKVVGRLATEISTILRGKDQVEYTRHTHSGDYVVVINAEHAVLTGNKMDGKIYLTYSGYQGGQKSKTPRELMKKDKTQVLYLAVKRMMSKIHKSALSRETLKKLKIYAGDQHPHTAQVSK
jgi:large subunit ribosomal protein L13